VVYVYLLKINVKVIKGVKIVIKYNITVYKFRYKKNVQNYTK